MIMNYCYAPYAQKTNDLVTTVEYVNYDRSEYQLNRFLDDKDGRKVEFQTGQECDSWIIDNVKPQFIDDEVRGRNIDTSIFLKK